MNLHGRAHLRSGVLDPELIASLWRQATSLFGTAAATVQPKFGGQGTGRLQYFSGRYHYVVVTTVQPNA